MKVGIKQQWSIPKQQPQTTEIELAILHGLIHHGQNVRTNIGKTFLKLIKHFPRDHRLHKIFNRDTLKLGYSCMSNMPSIIKPHNCKLLSTKNID